jgi:hypothetical protein
MHQYRLYLYDTADRLVAPAMVIFAENDEAAIGQSENMLDGVRAELWDGDRLVMKHQAKSRSNFRLEGGGKRPAASRLFAVPSSVNNPRDK